MLTKEQIEKEIAEMNEWIPVSKIEERLGMPPTTLQKVLKGTRQLPKKWHKVLEAYFIPKIIENNKPENKAKIEAERNGTANTTKKDFKQPLLPSEMSDKPIRSNFKDGFDYSIALAEWKEKQK